MAHVEPRAPGEVPVLQPVLEGARAAMGFIPNSMLTMAHMPQLPWVFSLLANVAFGRDVKPVVAALAAALPEPGDSDGSLPGELVQLVAFASSVAAGCRYCQAHTAHGAHRQGASQAKLDALLDYERSPEFSIAERAALALAFAAAAVPNESTSAHFDALREHFSERQIVQLVSVIALFGFLNRWNDTMATTLESAPVAFGRESLAAIGWQPEKHA
jgi:AhpD family alkylhydroperoxidase